MLLIIIYTQSQTNLLKVQSSSILSHLHRAVMIRSGSTRATSYQMSLGVSTDVIELFCSIRTGFSYSVFNLLQNL